MATPTSQRVSIIIIMVIFLVVGVGGTVIAVLESRKSPVKQTTNSQGKKMDNFTPVAKVDTLVIKDIKVGDGAEAKSTDTVTVHYTGAIASTGDIFESSKDGGTPATFPLSGVIAGWTQGVPGMKVGGTRRLLIPSSLAYGEAGSPPKIPGNTDLVFDIELLAVSDAAAAQQ